MHHKALGSWDVPMFDTQELRSKARDLALEARQTDNVDARQALTANAKSYLLLAKNAEWLESTDGFLKAVRDGSRWPPPNVITEAG
jgi:hypothetical protein